MRGRFYIDDLPVLFPYDYIYPEQYEYMRDIKCALDMEGHALLEMPSGTGKTVSILSIVVSYQQVSRLERKYKYFMTYRTFPKFYPDKRKLIYCSRTIPEIEKTLTELKRLMKYRKDQGEDTPFLGIGLSSRKNMCVHPEISKEKRGIVVDSRCHSLTAPWVRDKSIRNEDSEVRLCDFFEKLEAGEGYSIPSGVYSIDDLTVIGRKHGVCPYYLSRRMIDQANVIVYSYHYLLDPKIAELVSREIRRDSIIIFDEAHNIDNICTESLSMDITRPIIDNASKGLENLTLKVQRLKEENSEKLKNEYQMLVDGLKRTQVSIANDEFLVNPILPQDILNEAVPGNIRRAEHFINFLKRLIEYLKIRLRVMHVVAESPLSFINHAREVSFLDRKALRFCSERLASLLQTLEVVDLESCAALQKISAFATLVSTYQTGFIILVEPYENDTDTVPNPVLHLSCMDATIAIKPVFKRFSSIIITSGTLSPLDLYPTLLGFEPTVVMSYEMTLSKTTFLPLVVTRGSDQTSVSSRFESREDMAVTRNYGNLLLEYCKVVPDGLVCFFPSYFYMESIVSAWVDLNIIQQVLRKKLIFIETPDIVESTIALQNYRNACDNGRGAVMFCVARGKVSEGVDFDNNYGRAVILFGVPYQYTESRLLKARLDYLQSTYNIPENDFLTFDAMRHSAQCLGRILRNKTDYGIMVLADKRFSRKEKRSKLPKWINNSIKNSCLNLSTDMSVSLSKRFFKLIAQSSDQNQIGVSLWRLEDIERYERSRQLKEESSKMEIDT